MSAAFINRDTAAALEVFATADQDLVIEGSHELLDIVALFLRMKAGEL